RSPYAGRSRSRSRADPPINATSRLPIRAENHPLPLKFYAGSIVLTVLAVVAIAFGTVLAGELEVREIGLVLAGIGVLFAIAPLVHLARRSRRAATLEADEQGFTVWRRSGASERYVYGEIEWVAFAQKERLDNGERVGWTRRLALGGPTGAFELDSFSDLRQRDDMGALLDVVLEKWF